jgi:hypothetical protein
MRGRPMPLASIWAVKKNKRNKGKGPEESRQAETRDDSTKANY